MSKVILCVDDSVTMQTVAEITFRTTDYVYVGARSVDEALDKARAQRPALVLADAVMTGKNGYDLCHQLKSDPGTAGVPVVILCGNSAPYDATRGSLVGADGTLTKPWDTQVMLDKIAEMLEKIGNSGVAKAGKPAPATAVPMAISTPLSAPAIAPPAMAASGPASQAAAAAAAAQKAQPPRSATIMGMPTIKMPAPAGASGPISVPAPAVQAAPAAQATTQREPGFGGAQRAPMLGGIPTKRSALVERTLAKMGGRLAELSGLAPGSPELIALVKLSAEIVERVVWEVVPELAETIIREHVAELAAKRAN